MSSSAATPVPPEVLGNDFAFPAPGRWTNECHRFAEKAAQGSEGALQEDREGRSAARAPRASRSDRDRARRPYHHRGGAFLSRREGSFHEEGGRDGRGSLRGTPSQ